MRFLLASDLREPIKGSKLAGIAAQLLRGFLETDNAKTIKHIQTKAERQ